MNQENPLLYKEFAERLDKALKEKGYKKQSDTAKMLNITSGYMSYLLNGKSLPSDTLLSLLEVKTGISSHWVLTGEGEMFKKTLVKTVPHTQVPVLGRVPAGFPKELSLATEEVLDYINVPGIQVNTYAIIVHGDSMSPTIKDGDYAFFVPSKDIGSDIQSGDIIVVNNEYNESMIKRYRVKDGEFRLTSDNSEYGPIIPNEHFRIIGKVVDVWRKIKI